MSPTPAFHNAAIMQAQDLAIEAKCIAHSEADAVCNKYQESPQCELQVYPCTSQAKACYVEAVPACVNALVAPYMPGKEQVCSQPEAKAFAYGDADLGCQTHEEPPQCELQVYGCTSQAGACYVEAVPTFVYAWVAPSISGQAHLCSQAMPSNTMWMACAPSITQPYFAMQSFATETDQCYSPYGQAFVPGALMQADHFQIGSQPNCHAVQDGALSLFQGSVWQCARDADGCFRLQKALDDALSDQDRVTLSHELHTHVWEAIKCPHANHVLQKFIDTMRPSGSQFVINEIMQGGGACVGRIARHRFGCRILQRLLEHCSSNQIFDLVEIIILDARWLATHLYGNYVLQHVLEHCHVEDQISRLVGVLASNAAQVAAHCYGCAVLHKAFDYAQADARCALASSLVARPEVLLAMACSRHGHACVKLALQASHKEQSQEARSWLQERQEVLKRSRYGRVLSKYLDEFSDAEQALTSN
jgi:hypothetical protein